MSEVPQSRDRRPRGLGRIYRRGRVYWIQFSQRGKKYRESTGSEKKSTAVKLFDGGLGPLEALSLLDLVVVNQKFFHLFECQLLGSHSDDMPAPHLADAFLEQLDCR